MKKIKNLILFICMPLFLYAQNVNINVNKTKLNAGEELVVTISAQGKHIKFPQITKIDGVNITGTSSSDNISIINGNMQEIISHSFILYPTKSIHIPSFTVYIDGKAYKTKPVFVQVTKPKQTKGNFELDINVSDNNLYLGQSAILTLKFIQKQNAASIQIQRPVIKNFITKEISSNQIEKQNEKILIYKFLIIPQKSGTYNIGPFIAQIGEVKNTQSNDFFGLQIASVEYKNIYSNTLKIKVNDIPQNSIYGNFKISLNAKRKVKADEPNNVSLNIIGCGDFYSLGNFTLNIPNVTIYPSKPKKTLKIYKNRLCGVFTQTFSVIADKNYTIPSVSLKTFDKTLHTIKTKPLQVEVINSPIPQTINQTPKIIKKTVIIKTKSGTNPLIIGLISLISGIIIGFFIFFIYSKIKDEEIKQIKKADLKGLLNILKKYEENDKIKKIMQKIEENIYKNEKNVIDKKEIIKIIKHIRKQK